MSAASGTCLRRIKIYINVDNLSTLFTAKYAKIAKQGLFMTFVCAAMSNQICVYLRLSAVSNCPDSSFTETLARIDRFDSRRVTKGWTEHRGG